MIRLFYNRPSLAAALLLTALLTAVFFPFVFGNKTFMTSSREVPSVLPEGAWAGDKIAIQFYTTHDAAAPGWCLEPWLQLLKKEYLESRTLPVWNPYQGFGTPLAANMQSQAFHPATVLLALVHSPRTYNFYILLRLFVAGFFAYLFTRYFVGFIPAIGGGVAAMFGGYFMLFINMPHLSVEVLLPAALYCAEALLRRPRLQSVGWFALLIFFVLIGGMPESSLLLLSTTYAYLLFRVATDRSFWPGLWNRLRCLTVATIAGMCFSAILLLPFRQFLRYSYDVHQFSNTHSVTGLVYDAFDQSIVTYLFPFLFGPSAFQGLVCANYFGAMSLFLIVLAMISAFRRETEADKRLSWITVFFVAMVAGVISKRYGFFLVNWIGSLPFFNLVIFDKYEEALVTVSVAMLCAIGLDRLLDRRARPVMQVAALAVSFLTMAAALIWSKNVIAKEIISGANYQILGWAIMLPLCLLILLSLGLMLSDSQVFSGKTKSLFLPLLALSILCSEAIFTYIVPTYYVWNALPTTASNPYAGAPYINLLKSLAGNNRIYGANSVLYPNWSSAFGLYDTRNLDAMYYRKYLPFVRSFFRLAPPPSDGNELANRFTGAGGSNFTFQDYLEQRFLQLSSTRYLMMPAGTSLAAESVTDDIAQQGNLGLNPVTKQVVSRLPMKIGDSAMLALGGQAPVQLHYSLKPDAATHTLNFSYGINPAAFEFACGDGAEFVVDLKPSSGPSKRLFSSFIDPKHIIAERTWMSGSVDLSPYDGQRVDLLLSTNGGPKGELCGDWTYWSDFFFNGKRSQSPFKRIYDHEAIVYEYTHTLPRAAIYYHADVLPDDDTVLKGLGDPALDVFRTTLLNRKSLDSAQLAWLGSMDKSEAADPVEAASITSYSPREVVIRASLKKRGILVLNDTDYPGWLVTVDGKRGTVVNANYLFRGLMLEPGQHLVQFSYKPWSVTLGAAISSASMGGFALFALLADLKRRRMFRRTKKVVEVES